MRGGAYRLTLIYKIVIIRFYQTTKIFIIIAWTEPFVNTLSKKILFFLIRYNLPEHCAMHKKTTIPTHMYQHHYFSVTCNSHCASLYIRLSSVFIRKHKFSLSQLKNVAHVTGLEPAASRIGILRSIQLSYTCIS